MTVEVEQRVLTDTVVLRGNVSAGVTVEVSPTSMGAERAVVTGVRVEAGDRVEAGSVLLEVSGRPVFVLLGDFPAYRDVLPGARGPDVVQLQRSLRGLGFDIADAENEYGSATKAAVASLYEDLGYEAEIAGDPNALRLAQGALRAAQRAFAEAEEALDAIESGSDSGSGDPAGQSDAIAQAQRGVELAREDVDAAQREYDDVENATGAMLPFAEVVYLPEFPARVGNLNAYVGLDLSSGASPDSLLTVSSGDLVVRARVNPAERTMLSEGMSVSIVSELTGIISTGEISSIAEATIATDVGTRSHELTIGPTDGAFDEALADADVRLTIETASTEQEVLVVPLSAVFADGDGKVSVLKIDSADTYKVAVAPGVSGNGYVAVTPLDGGLAPGDEVVVGVRPD